MNRFVCHYARFVNLLKAGDFLAPLLMRLILAPVLIVAGFNKLQLADSHASLWQRFLASPETVEWFGDSQWGLGLPIPDVLAFLAGWTEFLGGWFLLVGFLTRLTTLPLMVIMLVAIFSVHWENGWFAIAPSSANASAALAWSWLGIPGAQESLANSAEVAERLGRIKSIVAEHGFPDYLYEKGSIVVLNNGIEFAAMYFVMLLSLLRSGAGKYLSLDFWLTVKCRKK